MFEIIKYRPLQPKDFDSFKELFDDVTKSSLTTPPKNDADILKDFNERLEKNKLGVSFHLAVLADGKFAGCVTLEYENWDKNSKTGRIHILIHPDFRNKGLATEAIGHVVALGFSKGFNEIKAQCKTSNKPMCHINETLGFEKKEVKLIDGVEKAVYILNQP